MKLFCCGAPCARIACAVFGAALFLALPAHAQYSGLGGFSEAFLRDYRAAQTEVNQIKSAQPLINLQSRYTNEVEQTELDVSIGLTYGQRTGVVNPSNAVVYFTRALRHELPERTYMEVLMWRGNAEEDKPEVALEDYLRGLVACSYYDLGGGWGEILNPKGQLFINSPDSRNDQLVRDYTRYRERLDFMHFVLRQRYDFVGAVKRIWGGKDEGKLLEILQAITPDPNTHKIILGWLKSENKRPNP